MQILSTLIAATVFTSAVATDVVLEDFSKPMHSYKQMNDPVMGGESTGTFKIENGVGIFDGKVVDVPKLKAPGFITFATSDGFFSSKSYPDISSCKSFTITAKASNDYKGYRVSFGNAHPSGGKFFAYGYKANFQPTVGEFGTISIDFDSFTDLWDDATGNAIKTCKEDSQYCPDEKTLKNIKTFSIWAEGVAGDVHLEIKSVGATGCSSKQQKSLLRGAIALGQDVFNNTCSSAVQSNLRYNISKTSAIADFPFPLPQSETLAQAVCCDNAFKAYAEPRETYARPDVNLFSRMNQDGTTIFYDSICGIPLFEAPKGRSFEDFKADTTEHGWPSFRPEELIQGNSRIINATGEVVSKCGTHLGSFLPDEKGDRWCLDLSCLSGSPKTSMF